jgi:hypothetical protein
MSTLLSLAYPLSRSSVERLYRGRQSHPNPLGLTRSKSETYPGNGLCQTHLSYLQCFQDVSLAKGAFFSNGCCPNFDVRAALVAAQMTELTRNGRPQGPPVRRIQDTIHSAATPVEPEHRGNRGLNSDVPARRHERSRRARPLSFSRWRPGEPSFDPRRPAPWPQALAYMDGLPWRKTPENTQKNIHTPKAEMLSGISDLSQKWGLDPKPECPLESTKVGLHRMHERRRFWSKYAWEQWKS